MMNRFRLKNKDKNRVDDINWGMIGLIAINILLWYCFLTNGFFHTLLWVMVGSAIIGIIIKLKENR